MAGADVGGVNSPKESGRGRCSSREAPGPHPYRYDADGRYRVSPADLLHGDDGVLHAAGDGN